MAEEINRLFEITCIGGVHINEWSGPLGEFTEDMKATIVLENGETFVYVLEKMVFPDGKGYFANNLQAKVGDLLRFNFAKTDSEYLFFRSDSRVVKILLENKQEGKMAETKEKISSVPGAGILFYGPMISIPVWIIIGGYEFYLCHGRHIKWLVGFFQSLF